jgi:hypothetical protein
MLTTAFECPLSHRGNGTDVHTCFDQMFDTGSLVTAKTEILTVINTKLKTTIKKLQSVSKIKWQINNNKNTLAATATHQN